MHRFSQHLCDEAATEAFGAQLAAQLCQTHPYGAIVFLAGELGAGKTTLVRGMLRSLGHTGAVKSPTYTLLEPYQLGPVDVFHFDLYRVNDPQELEFVGVDEIVDGPGLKLFEWAAKAQGWLPPPDVQVTLSVDDTTDPVSREVTVEIY